MAEVESFLDKVGKRGVKANCEVNSDRLVNDCYRWWFQICCFSLVIWEKHPILTKKKVSSTRTCDEVCRSIFGVHHKINPKDCQVLSLGDTGFLQFFRVVSRDYGKPRSCIGGCWVLYGFVGLVMCSFFEITTGCDFQIITLQR